MSAETERLQALFSEFNKKGSVLFFDTGGPTEPSRLGLQDSYTVIRAAGTLGIPDGVLEFHE
ncbi:MAG: hypothetical protein F4Z82_13930 [Caldilineaceae bacterium SB0668_bin_21]|nr:hypothetical protein [Caldilineaceae bacterium SB0668_bin_21]MYB40552.1 hypothetical protein [Candidatus Saccharibacteria bacterium]